MKILILAMPDSVDVMDYYITVPNLAIVSLAGNLSGHEVKVMDLVLYKPRIREPLEDLLRSFRPDIIGLSAMTFQFGSLLRIAGYIRKNYPDIKLAAGGYHVSLLARELTSEQTNIPLDFIIRGEGEITFKELADALGKGSAEMSSIAGLSFRKDNEWIHNSDRSLSDLKDLKLPDRSSRVRSAYHFLGMKADVAETSRGCLFNCKFCSITKMYGHTFRCFPVGRIIEDLRTIRLSGVKTVFFTDDNITFNASHFSSVCRAITDNRLNDMSYLVQVSAAGIAQNPDLVAEMDQANFRYVFVGFESMSPGALKYINKPSNPYINRKAADILHRHKITVIAGTVTGFPDDTRESIIEGFRLLRQLNPDLIMIQFLTPYPKTVLRLELMEQDLIENLDEYSKYDGYHCNIRTRYLSRSELYLQTRIELLKSNLHRSNIIHNLLLRNHPLFVLKAVSKTLLTRIYNIFSGQERRGRIDI
jgi:anaerobic magnesium-protoporphyrin IX monomethyl ester cyclase